MINLYARGAFVWMDEKERQFWYYPEDRTIIPLDNYNYPRSLRKFMEKSDFEYKIDTQTLEVVERCSIREQTWITPILKEAYTRLYKNGFLHSMEVYQSNELVGGLYGVTFRGAFFGESMFSEVSQASKSALIKLIEHLNAKGFVLLDVQMPNPHLEMFGIKEISLDEYDFMLAQAYYKNVKF